MLSGIALFVFIILIIIIIIVIMIVARAQSCANRVQYIECL